MFVPGIRILFILWATFSHVHTSTRTLRLVMDPSVVRNTCLENDLAFSTENVVSFIQCAGICLGDAACLSIVFSAENSLCDGCKSVYDETSNDSPDNTGALYYGTEGTEVTCPGEWFLFQDHCYLFDDEELHYTEAREKCIAAGSALVQVDSNAENTFLVNTMTVLPIPPMGYWCDLYQFGDDGVSETWRTSNDPLDQSVWRDNNPNDAGGIQKCHIFNKFDGFRFDDVECEERAERTSNAACEKPLH